MPPLLEMILDEAGVSIKTHSRDQAWVVRGRRTVGLPRPLDATRITALPAILLDGLLTVMAQEGMVCRLDVEYFLEELLVSVVDLHLTLLISFLTLFFSSPT